MVDYYGTKLLWKRIASYKSRLSETTISSTKPLTFMETWQRDRKRRHIYIYILLRLVLFSELGLSSVSSGSSVSGCWGWVRRQRSWTCLMLASEFNEEREFKASVFTFSHLLLLFLLQANCSHRSKGGARGRIGPP